MADAPVLISNVGSESAPNSYTLPPGLSFDPQAVTALFNGAAATTQFLAALSFYSQDGLLLGRTFPLEPVQAGGSVSVTYSRSLTDAAGGVPAKPVTGKWISAASTNSTLVRAGGGKIVDYFISNQGASVRYVKFYDKATAPTIGVDAALWTLPIPAGAAANLALNSPLPFTLGIGFGTTTGVNDNDSGAVGAGEIVINLAYV